LSNLAAAHLRPGDDRAIRANHARRDLSAVALSTGAVAAVLLATVVLTTGSDVHANARYVNMNLGCRRACDCNRSRADRAHHEFPHKISCCSLCIQMFVGSAHKRITIVLVHSRDLGLGTGSDDDEFLKSPSIQSGTL
jgi:hypothetical protein